MKKLLWFNAIASTSFLLLWLGIYGWWHSNPQLILKQLPQDTVENIKAITDLERLRKVNLLLIEKDRVNITQSNDATEMSMEAFGSFARFSFIIFLINSIWLYRLLRVQPLVKSGD